MAKKNNILYFDSEEQATKALIQEGKKLEEIVRKVWRLYESSYEPAQYIRTGKSMDSLKLGKVKKHSDDTLSIELTFVNRLAYHNSVFGGKKGHSIMLISEGWKVKRGWHRNIYRFGHYNKGKGFNIIGQVKELYESNRNEKVFLEVEWQGKEFKKKMNQENVLK